MTVEPVFIDRVTRPFQMFLRHKLAGAGLLHAERSFPIYATLAVVVSLMSIGLGVVYLLGFDILPAILI